MEKEQVEGIKDVVIRNVKGVWRDYWLSITAFVVLIVSCQLFNLTHSEFFYPLMFVSGWIVVMFALKFKSESSVVSLKNLQNIGSKIPHMKCIRFYVFTPMTQTFKNICTYESILIVSISKWKIE